MTSLKSACKPPVSTLQKLKEAKSLKDVAPILGIEPHVLSYLLYILPTAQKYKTFEIKKKSGGTRQINAPTARLKSLQGNLAKLLYECADEIDKQTKRKPLSHGYRHSHSIITNAYPHKNRRYVLNIDLENFFPTFNFGRVRGYFWKNNDFSLNEKVATVLAQIACHGNELPQGSPCSPIIADLIAHVLDVRLVRLAKAEKCTYTRYADDITFSTSQRSFPKAIAYRSDDAGSEWYLGQELLQTIKNANFFINHSKTRMQCRASRQLVTGLTVNVKVNIRKDYYKTARAMCDAFFRTGEYLWPGSIPPTPNVSSINKIEGVLNHIFFVKDVADARTAVEKADEPTSARALYKDLLFFKYFVKLEKPLVVCEGKTDPIYLKAAIHSLKAFHPTLAVMNGPALAHKLSFFNYSNLAHKILDIGGGTGGQVALIRDYQSMIAKFKHAPLKHPVIVLIDNDSGSSPVFGIIKKKFNINPSIATTATFYHLCHNLYLIKTPEKPPTGVSMIEDFFEPSLVAATFGGKTLNLTNKDSAANEIGKSAFAELVRANASKIDFSDFSDLLNRIVGVLNNYSPPKI